MLLDVRQRELLRLIWRENRLSRWELHERTGVNPNAIGNEAGYLLQLGILREGAPESEAILITTAERRINLRPGKAIKLPTRLTLPAELTTGNYILTAVIDTTAVFNETDETNNTLAATAPLAVI